LKYSEKAEVSEETKKMGMTIKIMMGRRWREKFKSDAREIDGAGS
jgi:hypothetical protein